MKISLSIVSALMLSIWADAVVANGYPAQFDATKIAPAPRPLPEGISSIKDCDVCPEMVVVPLPDGFYGAPAPVASVKQKNRKPASPQKKRTLAIARYELTLGQFLPAYYEGACPALMTSFEGPEFDMSALPADDRVLFNLRFEDVECYLSWLGQKTGKRYRLPTPEEWLHAARAGAKTRFPWGDEVGMQKALVLGQFSGDGLRFGPRIAQYPFLSLARPVGQLPPNAWGLYDVIGNLPELTSKERPGTFEARFKRWGAEICKERLALGGSMAVEVGELGLDWQNWYATTVVGGFTIRIVRDAGL